MKAEYWHVAFLQLTDDEVRVNVAGFGHDQHRSLVGHDSEDNQDSPKWNRLVCIDRICGPFYAENRSIPGPRRLVWRTPLPQYRSISALPSLSTKPPSSVTPPPRVPTTPSSSYGNCRVGRR